MNGEGRTQTTGNAPKISERKRPLAGGSRPKHTERIPSPQAGPTANNDALVLIAPEFELPHPAEPASRFSISVPDVRLCSFGTNIRADLDALMAGDPFHVVAVPICAGAADPLLSELPGLIRWAAMRWPNSRFLLSEPIGVAQHVAGWASRQARLALRDPQQAAVTGETGLLVVGAGGSAPAANAEVCAIGRLLWENRGYGLVETAFARYARPTVAEGIDRLLRLGAGRIVILPLSFLDGTFYREVQRQAESVCVRDLVLARPLLSATGLAAVARQRYESALARWFKGAVDGLSTDHDHGFADYPMRGGDALLPPRYREGGAARTAPMRSARLRYDAEGRVAWDQVWQSFCDLALAGGPPHRGTLLEPAMKEEVRADPHGYSRVAAEIARGLTLVTGLPAAADAAPGWVGLACRDEEMAVWMLRAIVVENVCVRRDGATLLLPAGPGYRVDKEVKNVITAVAKTHHYWTEHRAAP